MTIIILSRLVTDCKAADVHSEHQSWIDGQQAHNYKTWAKNTDAAMEEHRRLEEYAMKAIEGSEPFE